jgi:hypothetical protein
MKSILALLFLIICSCAEASAQTPRITHSEPSRLVVEPDALGTTTVTLYGSNLTRSDTTGFTINNDVQIFVRGTSGSGAFEQLPMTGWTVSQMSVQLDKKTYMSRADRLEFKVVVRGVGDSNVQAVEVMPYPTVPPQIQSSELVRTVRSMPLNKDENSSDRAVTLNVKNLTADTKVFIRGKEASIGYLIPGDERVKFWIPQDFQRLGDYYTVQLKNRNGESNTTRLLVVTPPSILSVNPSALEISGNAPQTIKIDYASLQKPEAFVRAPGDDNWQSVALSDAGELTIPKTLLAQSGTLQIKLKTIGGEETADLVIKQVMMVAPNIQGPPKIITPIDPKPIRIIPPKVIKPLR